MLVTMSPEEERSQGQGSEAQEKDHRPPTAADGHTSSSASWTNEETPQANNAPGIIPGIFLVAIPLDECRDFTDIEVPKPDTREV